MNDNVES